MPSVRTTKARGASDRKRERERIQRRTVAAGFAASILVHVLFVVFAGRIRVEALPLRLPPVETVPAPNALVVVEIAPPELEDTLEDPRPEPVPPPEETPPEPEPVEPEEEEEEEPEEVEEGDPLPGRRASSCPAVRPLREKGRAGATPLASNCVTAMRASGSTLSLRD